MSGNRSYLGTHPWLTFEFQTFNDPIIWMSLGEAQSKCEHVAGAPLRPEVAMTMHQFYLAKGILATTAIEGNTLSQDEVEKRIRGELKLPPTKEYLGIEIDNILNASNRVLEGVMSDGLKQISLVDLLDYNKMVLADLEVEDPTIPGTIREHRVTVGRYRGAPPEDCRYLMERLCEWMNGDTFKGPEGMAIVYGILKAIVAHLYIAWIHPFGDGNGRTARLLEVRILLEAGAPSAAAHLLSNHYNQTRSEYYRQLDEASRSGGNIVPFIKYAVQGLVDQLREQVERIRSEQHRVTWINYVHERFKESESSADVRRRKLLLEISEFEGSLSINKLRRLSVAIVELYAGKTNRTLQRDINILAEMGLVHRNNDIVRVRKEITMAFLPDRLVPHDV